MKFRTFTAGTALAGFLAGAYLMAPAKTNPRVIREHTVEANTTMSPAAAGVLRRACMNCHSNETKWPAYSYIPPFSTIVTRDVENARKVMNFSEWSTQAGRRPGLAASFLAASCSDMKVRRMPTTPYLLLHPEAKLSQADVDSFCSWTREEITRLKDRKRTQELRASR